MSFAPLHLKSTGPESESVSVVLAPSASGVPMLLHWGPTLGELSEIEIAEFARSRGAGRPHSALDEPRVFGVVPDSTSGFTGLPGLEGWRHPATGAWAPQLRDWSAAPGGTAPDGRHDSNGIVLTGRDGEAGWEVDFELWLTAAGLLCARTRVVNSGDSELVLAAVRTVLPVGAHATELLDLTGRWCKERTPQRHPWVQGIHLREGRHGRTGHDASILMVTGTPGFGFGHGEVWGVHVAWSGDHAVFAQRTPEGECLLGGGELLAPGEVGLPPGGDYVSPWVLGSWSGDGLDVMSARFHHFLRARSPRARSERKVVVNTWEATYFDQDLDRLIDLAQAASDAGVERFVLDDGWFAGRRDDTAGLGDWTVDKTVWPQGLPPLIDAVHSRGMDFGLWVEPEMVNENSDVARLHPDWILRGRTALPAPWRHQQVLDLQVPQAFAYVRDALLALLDHLDIAYLKWDHNRDLIDVAHGGRPAVHGQTLAFYRLLDELREAHPALEIESCASGGGRVDAEVLARTDRLWPSDTIDALERQHIQRWTSLLVPPELIGSHIGGPIAHTTGRSQRLGYRAATALLWSFGVEWDLSSLDRPAQQAVRRWIRLHKQIRPLIARGHLVHGDHPDPAVLVTGIVAPDASEGWYVVATVAALETQSPTPVRFPGLANHRTYRLACVTPTLDQHGSDMGETWTREDPLVLPGAVIGAAGVRLPVLPPESAQVFHAVAVDPASVAN